MEEIHLLFVQLGEASFRCVMFDAYVSYIIVGERSKCEKHGPKECLYETGGVVKAVRILWEGTLTSSFSLSYLLR